LLDKGAKYVAGSNERATQVLTGIKNIDQVYKTVAGMQAMEASRIMGILDETIIHENPEYIALTKQVAQAFNDMWYAFGKRWVDFYLSPGEEFVKDHWGYYQEIIKGLPQKVIDTLDEKGWDLVLDDMARNHGKWQFKNQFIKERDEKRDMKRKQEQDEEDKKYWETHRAEYKRKLKLEKELKKLEQTISAKRENKLLLDKQRAPFRAEYFNISGQISEKYRDIARLEKKIFGKKKAKEEIAMIRKEIISLEDKNKAIDADIAGYNEAIQKLERAISDLQSRINDLQQQIVELRAHN
jgi:hypothetical protein